MGYAIVTRYRGVRDRDAAMSHGGEMHVEFVPGCADCRTIYDSGDPQVKIAAMELSAGTGIPADQGVCPNGHPCTLVMDSSGSPSRQCSVCEYHGAALLEVPACPQCGSRQWHHGPTNHRGSRVIATGPALTASAQREGRYTRVTVAWDYAGGPDLTHRRAAEAVAGNLRANGWDVYLDAGDDGATLPDESGRVFILRYR